MKEAKKEKKPLKTLSFNSSLSFFVIIFSVAIKERNQQLANGMSAVISKCFSFVSKRKSSPGSVFVIYQIDVFLHQ